MPRINTSGASLKLYFEVRRLQTSSLFPWKLNKAGIKGRSGSDSVQFRHNKLGLLFWKFSELAFVVRIFFGALNLSFLFVEEKHAYFKPKKPASHCAEIDSYHGDYLDSGICIGFLSHSIFGISIRHHQQLSRYVSWPRSLFPFIRYSVRSLQVVMSCEYKI